jgi:hypothetical protein
VAQHDEWTYRCTAVCGQTLNGLSPFIHLNYEAALASILEKNDILAHMRELFWGVCDLVGQIHAGGIAHGDLTLHNALWADTDKPVLIDLAASARLADLPVSKRQAAINDDFSELYRNLVLAQFHIGPLNNAHAQNSIQLIEDLFPHEILPILSRLTDKDWSDEMP